MYTTYSKYFLFLVVFIISFFFFRCTPVFSHGYGLHKKDSITFTIDTTYINYFKTKIGIRPKFKSGSLNTTFSNDGDYIKTSGYYPLAGGLTITILNFDISFAINSIRNVFKRYNYGSSTLQDFSFNYYKRKLVYEFILRNNERFYNRYNLNSINSIALPKSTYNFNLSDFYFGVNFNYVANASKFSYKAAYSTSTRQLKSCGSNIFSIILKSNDLEANYSTIFPALPSTSLESIGNVQKISTFSIFPRYGYAYTFVYKNFTVSAADFVECWRPNQSWTFFDYKLMKGWQESKRYWYFKNALHLQSGFNWKKLYAGLSYDFDTAYTSWHDINIKKTTYNFVVFGGYRITTHHDPNKKKVKTKR